jgi:cytochrome b561
VRQWWGSSLTVQVLDKTYTVSQAGLPALVFGARGLLLPDFWVFPMRYVHHGFSRLLIALIGLHVVGAAYHIFIRRDGLLNRIV